jgi:hypothetical protein
MTNIENRLAALEKAAIQRKPIEPMPIFILPEEGSPERASIQAKIDALEMAGKKVIVIVRPNARL